MGRDKYSEYKILYEKYLNQMFSYGKALGVEDDTLYDLIHDVFLHLFEHSNEVGKSGQEKFYLLRCLKNRIIQNRRQVSVLNLTMEETELPFTLVISDIGNLEEEEERKEIACQIEKMMQCLTNHQREAIYLRFMQELEYDEIADILKLTPKGTRKLIYRAIERIRDKYCPGMICFLFYNHFL